MRWASYRVRDRRLNNNFKVFLLPVRGSIAQGFLEVLPTRHKLGSGLRSGTTDSGHDYNKLTGSRVQYSPNNCKVATFAGRIYGVQRPLSSARRLLPNVAFPILFDKREVEILG